MQNGTGGGSKLQQMAVSQVRGAAAGIFPKLQEVTNQIVEELVAAEVPKANDGMILALLAAAAARCKGTGYSQSQYIAEACVQWDVIQIAKTEPTKPV